MATHDFRKFENDYIVIHFGGSLTSINAYTFANSLIAFADTARAVNASINPGQEIEIRLEAIGPGSYRAVVRRIKSGLGGFFSRGSEAVFWGLVATVIWENVIKTDVPPQITIKTDEVIIQHGKDRVIVPRQTYEQLPNVRSNPEVRQGIRETFQILDNDAAVQNFGLTTALSDAEPLVEIPRREFGRLVDLPVKTETTDRRRKKKTRARILISKAWLDHPNRKWTFQWNDVPISARILDANFFERLDRREYLLGAGDALDADLSYEQQYNEDIEMFENDPQSYVVERVHKIVKRTGGKQGALKVR
jgi:hypothetical protein